MSNVDDDVADRGLDALRTARVEGLHRRLDAFLDEHDGTSTSMPSAKKLPAAPR